MGDNLLHNAHPERGCRVFPADGGVHTEEVIEDSLWGSKDDHPEGGVLAGVTGTRVEGIQFKPLEICVGVFYQLVPEWDGHALHDPYPDEGGGVCGGVGLTLSDDCLAGNVCKVP